MRSLAVLILLAGLAQADDVRAKVKAKIKAGRHVEAAQILGKALAAAQRDGDILLIQEHAETLREEFAKLDPLENPKKRGGYRDVCHTLMKSLDPKRGDAFVSAHHLAYELIHQCVRGGDDRHLADAVAVATVFARQSGAGQHAFLMYRVAEAVLAARKKDANAERMLRTLVEFTIDRLDGLMARGLVSVELAEILRARGDAKGAGAVLADQREMLSDDPLPDDADVLAMIYYVDAIQQRRGKAPRAYTAALAKLMKFARATRPDPDKRPPAKPNPALRKAWKTYPANKPLVWYRGGMLELGFYEQLAALDLGTAWSRVEQENGITVQYWMNGIALVRIDLAGRSARRTDVFLPPRWLFFDVPLPGKERWSVDKRGIVTITKRG